MAASEPIQPAELRRARERVRLPIVERVPTYIGAAERWRIRRIAGRLRRESPGGGLDALIPPDAEAANQARTRRPASAARGAGVHPGSGYVDVGLSSAPVLHLHDLQPVLAPSEQYWNASEYRALLMAEPGDLIALWTRREPAFEEYCRDVLGILGVKIIHVPRAGGGIPLSLQCRRDPTVLSRLAEFAAISGGLNLMPYIGSDSAWLLAAAIARRAGVPVHVGAPRPRVTRVVNNKLWFTAAASEVLGENAVPDTASVHDSRVLISVLRALAREHDRVALKLPSASAGTGNLVIETDAIRRVSWNALEGALRRLFRGLHWERPYPLLVSIWERPVIMTPSVQLWIPDFRHRRRPVVEGIFAQEVAGPVAEFMGAVPAQLPGSWESRLAGEAARVATLFQELGYFGRCSLDAILVGPSLDAAELHWVESNGRWGGTSIPLTVANRFAGGGLPSPLVIAYDVKYHDFSTAVARTRDLLFRPAGRTGVIYLSPGNKEAGRGIDFLAIGRSPEDAGRCAREVRERLAA